MGMGDVGHLRNILPALLEAPHSREGPRVFERWPTMTRAWRACGYLPLAAQLLTVVVLILPGSRQLR